MNPSPRLAPRALVTLVLLAVAVAVGGSGCRTEAGSARSLVDAVGRFRRAPDAEKGKALASIREVKCGSDEVCAAQKACLAYAEPTEEAIRIKLEIAQGLASLADGGLPDGGALGETGDYDTRVTLLARVGDAQKKLKEGYDQLTSCDDAVQKLEARFPR